MGSDKLYQNALLSCWQAYVLPQHRDTPEGNCMSIADATTANDQLHDKLMYLEPLESAQRLPGQRSEGICCPEMTPASYPAGSYMDALTDLKDTA